MEPVHLGPPVVPFNVRVERLNARGERDGRAYVRARGHNTFGYLINKTFDHMMWGDPNDYDWTSGTVILQEYYNGRSVQMWAYGLPLPGQVMRIVGQPKMNNAFLVLSCFNK